MTEEQRSFVMSEDDKYWYVVYTKPRWEKKVSLLLENQGIEYYCPLNKVVKQWSDRKKVILEPLFKGYVFVNIAETFKWDIKKIDGILNYVYWLGKPARVREDEINTIRKFLQEFKDVEVVEQQLTVHSNVLIKQGVLMNFKGIIIEVIGNKARVNVDSMGIRLSALFDKKNLEASNV